MNNSNPAQAWLVSSGRVLASAVVASTRRERRNGIIGRQSLEGAFVIPQCRWIHTVGVRFPIDVAYLDAQGMVLKTETLGRFRIGAPVAHACMVIEACSGAFDRWGLRIGDLIEVRPADTIGS
jgi:uncharacterized membrane protein (UPF0127 family)